MSARLCDGKELDMDNFDGDIAKIVFRQGGQSIFPFPPELERESRIYELTRDITVLDDLCDECDWGHKLSSGLYGVLNTLSWLLFLVHDGEYVGKERDGEFVDNSREREMAVAALPAFTIVFRAAYLHGGVRQELIERHPEFTELYNLMEAVWAEAIALTSDDPTHT